MRDFLIFVAALCVLIISFIVIAFKLMPACTFICYDKVVVESVQPFRMMSYADFKVGLTVEYNDIIWCETTKIVIPTVKVRKTRKIKSVDPWTPAISLDSVSGEECDILYDATPTLFGLIRGKEETGRSNTFIAP